MIPKPCGSSRLAGGDGTLPLHAPDIGGGWGIEPLRPCGPAGVRDQSLSMARTLPGRAAQGLRRYVERLLDGAKRAGAVMAQAASRFVPA